MEQALDVLIARELTEGGHLEAGSASTYRSGFRGWKDFCALTLQDVGRAVPAAPEDVARYYQWLRNSGKGADAVKTARHGIRDLHGRLALADPTKGVALQVFRSVMKKQRRARPVRRATTLDLRQVQSVVSLAASTRRLAVLQDAIIVLVGIVTLLRGGSLGRIRRGHLRPFNAGRPTMRRLGEGNIEIYVPRQKGRYNGTWKSIWVRPAAGRRCLTRLLLRYLEQVDLLALSRATKGAPIFFDLAVWRSGGRRRCLSTAAVSDAVRRTFARIGVTAGKIASHSLRRTGAEKARAEGRSIKDIQVLGNWETERTARIYLQGQPLDEARLHRL